MGKLRQKLNQSPRFRKRVLIAGVSVLAVLAVVGLMLALLAGRGDEYEPLPEKMGDTFSYGGEEVPILENVNTNPYDSSLFYYNDAGYMFYDSDDVPAIAGVDVSTFQGWVDWEKVRAAGFEFAMIRVGYRGYSEGDIFADNRFFQNINGALEAGVKVGIYFFSQATTVQEAIEEAEWTVSMIQYYDISYPVAYDFEYYSFETRASGVSGAELNEFANAFCGVIEAAGYTPMVYFNRDLAYLSYDLSQIDRYDFWLAELQIPTFYYEFSMLQYSHTGKVDGIEGDVDLNLSFIDYAAMS